MIIIFLLFTMISIFLRTRESRNIQECLPFFMVTTLSWISFILYMYLNETLFLFITFEVTSLLVMITLGKNIERFFKLKMISYFLLSLLSVFEGSFEQDLIYLYIVLSVVVALTSTFRIDKKISFPFILFNVFSLMKAREIIESPFSVDLFVVGMIALILYIVKHKFRIFTGRSRYINILLWAGVFTFSINLYFLLISIFILLTILLLNNFEIKKLIPVEDTLLYLVSLIILVPLSRVSFSLMVICLCVFSICLFFNKKTREIGLYND